MTEASDYCRIAAGLVSGERAATYGDKLENCDNIAILWSAWLGVKFGAPLMLAPKDVPIMMALLKLARSLSGVHHPDNFFDATGYAAIAGELADIEASMPSPPPDAKTTPEKT